MTERDFTGGRRGGKACPFTSVEGWRFMELAEAAEKKGIIKLLTVDVASHI